MQVPGHMEKEVFTRLLRHAGLDKQLQVPHFRREEMKYQALLSDLLLRDLLSRRTGLECGALCFIRNEFGKPFLDGHEDVQFNLSHSDRWVTVVLDRHPVGVDVQVMEDMDLDVADQFFSLEERRDLIAKEDKSGYFFTLWTLKESFIKILGKGLSQPLNEFSIKYFSGDRIVMLVGGRPVAGVCFRTYDIDSGYKMAVCAAHDRFPDYVKTCRAEDVIEKFMAMPVPDEEEDE